MFTHCTDKILERQTGRAKTLDKHVYMDKLALVGWGEGVGFG